MAGRGTRTIGRLFPEETLAQVDVIESQGRDPLLIKERNEWICARLYWYKAFTRIDYDEIIRALKDEFKISEYTIRKMTQIPELQVEMRRLVNTKPNVNYFKKRWWYMEWDAGKMPVK